MRHCRACGAEIEIAEKVLRTGECPECGRDLHGCLNCRHHLPSAHNQCLEPVAEWVSDQERANFCDYYSFADSPGRGESGAGKSSEEEAREKWKRLFKS